MSERTPLEQAEAPMPATHTSSLAHGYPIDSAPAPTPEGASLAADGPRNEAGARRAALAAGLRKGARVVQALTFIVGVYIAYRTIQRGGSIAGADKTDLVLGAVAIVIGLTGFLRNKRGRKVDAWSDSHSGVRDEPRPPLSFRRSRFAVVD